MARNSAPTRSSDSPAPMAFSSLSQRDSEKMASSSMLLKMILVSSGFMGREFGGDVSEAVETVREGEARVWMTHW